MSRYYQSKWATMHSDDEFLITPEYIAAVAKRKQKEAEEDADILELMADLDNGSISDDAEASIEQNKGWNEVVTQFRNIYKISYGNWQLLLQRVQQIKRAQPAKKMTCSDLIDMAEKLKTKNKKDKQETE